MRRSPLLPIFLIVLVDVLGLTIVIPLLAIYAESFGASAFTAALLMTTFAACQLVAGPFLGKLSDRYGRRPILLVSQVGTLIGFVMMAEAQWLWMVFAGRALDGLTAGNLTVAQAYISDHTPPEKRARAFGLIGIAFGLGFLVGPAVSGLLSHYSLAAPFWAAAALSATSILGTYFLLPREEKSAHARHEAETGEAAPGGRRLGLLDWAHYKTYLERPVLRGLLVQFFIYMFAFSLFTSGFALYAERHLYWDGELFTPREIGFTFAASGLLGAIVQGGLIGRLVARFGEVNVAAAGFLSLGIGYVFLGLTATVSIEWLLWVLALATVFTALGSSVIRPNLTALVTRLSARHEQGVVLGLTQSLSSIAAIVAPPVSGFLIQHDQGQAWAWLAAAGALLGVALTPRGAQRAAAHAGEPGSPISGGRSPETRD